MMALLRGYYTNSIEMASKTPRKYIGIPEICKISKGDTVEIVDSNGDVVKVEVKEIHGEND